MAKSGGRMKMSMARMLWCASHLGLMAAGGAMLPQAAQAQAAEAQIRFEIPAGPLAEALRRYSEATGVQLVYSSELVEGRTSLGVSGFFSKDEALQRVLAGSNLAARFAGNTATIQAAGGVGERVLGAVRIEGAQDGSYGRAGQAARVNGVNGSRDITATEGTGSYTSGALTVGSKAPQSIKDTPQAVSIVTQQRIQDQGITDFTSLMDKSVGITTVTTTNSLEPSFYSRGFLIQRMQIDGGAPIDISGQLGLSNSGGFGVVPSFDLAVYDHAEILRGADGLFNGYGAPGGVINLTRKRPLERFQLLVETQAGSWNNYRGMIDVSGPLGFDGKLRGRAVMVYQDQEYFYDLANSNKTVVYGIVEADVLPSTTLSIGFNSAKQTALPFFSGLPRYEDGADLRLPRDTCFCFPWNQYRIETNEILARIEQDFGGDWSGTLNVGRMVQERVSKRGNVERAVNPTTLTGPIMRARMSDNKSTQITADFNLNGSFPLFGHDQKLTVGGNYLRSKAGPYKGFSRPNTGNPAVDVFDFDPFDPAFQEPAPGVHSGDILRYGTEQLGAYATFQLTLWEPLHFTAGIRYSSYRFTSESQDRCTIVSGCEANEFSDGGDFGDVIHYAPPQTHSSSDFSWPPVLAVTWDVSRDLSAHLSYSSIYEEQSTFVDRDLVPLRPVTGGNIEAGIKWAPRDGRLNASLSVYEMRQKNRAFWLGYGPYEDTSGYLPDQIHQCCYVADDTLQYLSRGIDAEVNGEITDGWQIAVGYTFNKNELVYPPEIYPNDGDPLVTLSPKHLFKLWTSYRFREGQILRGLELGGGVTAQSSAYTSGTACTEFGPPDLATGIPPCIGSADFAFTQKAYALLSMRAGYELSKNWKLALNVDNLANKRYYQTMGTSTSGNWYGQPRSFMLSLRGNW